MRRARNSGAARGVPAGRQPMTTAAVRADSQACAGRWRTYAKRAWTVVLAPHRPATVAGLGDRRLRQIVDVDEAGGIRTWTGCPNCARRSTHEGEVVAVRLAAHGRRRACGLVLVPPGCAAGEPFEPRLRKVTRQAGCRAKTGRTDVITRAGWGQMGRTVRHRQADRGTQEGCGQEGWPKRGPSPSPDGLTKRFQRFVAGRRTRA